MAILQDLSKLPGKVIPRQAVDLRTPAQRRRDFFFHHKLATRKPEVIGVGDRKVTYGDVKVARGSNYLHRKTARALPMRSWVAEL